MAVCQGPRAQTVRLHFCLHLHLAGKYLRKFQSASGPTQCKSGPGNKTVCRVTIYCTVYNNNQRWSPRGRPWPRGHVLKSLALASKVKSLALASRPQVLENWPVLGSRTARFFELLKFCGALEKFFGKRVFVEID